MKKLSIILAVALLSGCSTLSKVMDMAADVNDEALVSAEFTICAAASVGAIERRYNSKELLDARRVLCERKFIGKD